MAQGQCLIGAQRGFVRWDDNHEMTAWQDTRANMCANSTSGPGAFVKQNIHAETDICFGGIRLRWLFEIPTLKQNRIICRQLTRASQHLLGEVDACRESEPRGDRPCDRTGATAKVQGMFSSCRRAVVQSL